MAILTNAIEAIQVGIEDFQEEDDRRSLSAVRNIFAGILLLYKEKLVRLSPAHDKELLIKRDISPIQIEDGSISFEGSGNKTVDVHGIKSRFKSLNVNVDWKRFDEISRLRNDIEHYYTSKSPSAIREVVAKSFILIHSFISAELKEDPRESLGEECWNALLKVAEVYEEEQKNCHETLASINWKYRTIEDSKDEVRCPSCHSSLIRAPYSDDVYPTINLSCANCGIDFSFDEIAEELIAASLGNEYYWSVKDGGEPPYGRCPSCERDTFVYAEKSCVCCEEGLEYEVCYRCSASLSLEDQHLDGLCSYCHYVWDKMKDD